MTKLLYAKVKMIDNDHDDGWDEEVKYLTSDWVC